MRLPLQVHLGSLKEDLVYQQLLVETQCAHLKSYQLVDRYPRVVLLTQQFVQQNLRVVHQEQTRECVIHLIENGRLRFVLEIR